MVEIMENYLFFVTLMVIMMVDNLNHLMDKKWERLMVVCYRRVIL